MNRELSHGLPELLTSGNRILRADTMRPVLLRGVNRSGLEYSEPDAAGFLTAAQFTREEINEITKVWGSNVVRIPFNQDWCLRGRGKFSAESYLASLDQVISWNAENGAYTILDLQWLDMETAYGTTRSAAEGRITNHVPPTPDGNTVELWRVLAGRYRNEPAVLFDLLNEPHDALIDDPNPLRLIGLDGSVVVSDEMHLSAQAWGRWASHLTAEIRRIRPEAVLLVGGVDWAFDLSETWVDAPNIIYSTHIYANRPEKSWKKAFNRYREIPIFVGEWGGGDQDLEFGRKLAARMRSLELGWAAWSWRDIPHLVLPSPGPNFEPTRFGSLVRDELSSRSPTLARP